MAAPLFLLHLLDSPPPPPMSLKPPFFRLRSTRLLHRAASRESSNGISFGGEFSVSNDDSNDQLSSVDDSCAKCGGGKVEEDARNMAIKFLAARAITVAKLRKKLTGRKYHRKVIDSVITYLQNRGLVNDELYAESFSRSRWLANTWGPRRIKKALLDRGISAEDADKATARVFEDGASSGSNQCGVPSMSQLSMDHLLTQASKQWLRYQNKSAEQRKSAMIRWLQYRGFNWATINIIMKKL